MSNEKVEIKFVTLACGHSVIPNRGIGVCSKCRKACCGDCLQRIDGEVLCPECLVKFVREKYGKTTMEM